MHEDAYHRLLASGIRGSVVPYLLSSAQDARSMKYEKPIQYPVNAILFAVGYRYGLENGKQKAQARQDVSNSMVLYCLTLEADEVVE